MKTKSSTAVSWQSAPTTLSRRCVFQSIYGDTGTGRTTLALTAPGPIALIHAAEKLEGVVQPFSKEKEIKLLDFSVDLSSSNGQDQIAKEATETWRRLRTAWYDAFSWAKTIVLDTDTEAWELIRLAAFGALQPTKGRIDSNYGPVNAEWRSLFKHFRHQDSCSIIAIGQTKDEYKEAKRGGMGERTGRTIRAGQKEVSYMADVVVRTSRDLTDNSFQARIEKGWWNAHVEGLELEDEEINYAGLMGLVTETDEEEWV